MMESEQDTLECFMLNFQSTESYLVHHLSLQFANQPIAINLSPFSDEPIICLYDNENPNQMAVSQLLRLLAKRWQQEAILQDEILLIKNHIIENCNQLCDGLKNEKIIIFLRNKRQQIVQLLLNLSKSVEKNKAGEFCKALLNKNIFIPKFEEIVHYVLFKPFECVTPVGLNEYMREIFKNELKKLTELHINNAFMKIIKYICMFYHHNKLKVKDYKSIIELKNIIEEFNTKRKLISLWVDELGENHQVIRDERLNISHVILSISYEDFINSKILFVYETLELNNLPIAFNKQDIINKLPKGLTKICFNLGNTLRMETILEVTNLIGSLPIKVEIYLKLSEAKLTLELTNGLLALIKNSKQKKIFLIKNLNYENNQATDKDLINLACVISNSKKMNSFSIDCSKGTVSSFGVLEIMQSLKKQQNLETLVLNFSNEIQLHSCMANPKSPHDYFYFVQGKNSVDDDGLASLSTILANMPNISKLVLDFSNYYWRKTEKLVYRYWMDKEGMNSIGDEGMKNISNALKKMKSIKNFSIHVGGAKKLRYFRWAKLC